MVNNKGLNALRSAAILLVSSNLVSAAPAALSRRDRKPGDQLCGPTEFCLGLTPGGSTCIPVDEGCCITIPLGNVIPTPVCDSQDDGNEEGNIEKRRIRGSDLFSAGTSVVDAGLTLAGIFGGNSQPPAQPVQKRSLQDDMNNVNEFLSQAGVQARDEKRRIKGSDLFSAGTSVVDAGLTLAGIFGGNSQPPAQPAQKRSLQDDMNNVKEFLSQAQSGDLEARRISGSSILNSIGNIADVVSLAGTVGQATGILPSKRSLQEDMDNVKEFLSQAQSGDLEARRISGSSILNSIGNIADVVSLAGTVGQATGILPSKRSLQEDMENVKEFLSQAQSGDLEARRISGSSILNSIGNIADVVSIAGTVGQATGLLPSKRSLQEDMDNVKEFLSQAQSGDLEARRISGSSILNSIGNIADVVSLAGTVGQATGILPSKRSLQEDMDNVKEFLSQAQSGDLEARRISGSSILNSIGNIADVVSIAGTVGQATGLLPSKRSLQEDMDNVKEFLSQAQSGDLEARRISGSSILNSIGNIADVVSIAGTVGQATGILPRAIFGGKPKLPESESAGSVPRLGPGIPATLRLPALSNPDPAQKRSIQDEIKELIGAIGARDE